MGTRLVYPEANEQPYDGHDEQEPRTAPYGRCDESQAHQARCEIGRPVLGSCEVIIRLRADPARHYLRLGRE